MTRRELIESLERRIRLGEWLILAAVSLGGGTFLRRFVHDDERPMNAIVLVYCAIALLAMWSTGTLRARLADLRYRRR